MKKDFDFDKTGKREPYAVPDNFFSDLQDKIKTQTVQTRRPKIFSWRYILSGVASVAAVAAIVITVGLNRHKTTTFEDVDQCFALLNDADQQYLLDTYQEDIFMDY